MAKINKEIFKKMVGEGFFDNPKTNEVVIKRLDQKGFSISGKKSGLVGQLLTKLCQEGILEREKNENNNWEYRKI